MCYFSGAEEKHSRGRRERRQERDGESRGEKEGSLEGGDSGVCGCAVCLT